MVSIVFYLFQSCRCFSVVTRTQNNKTTLFRVKPFLAHQMSYCTTISRRSGSETWATLQFTAPVLWDTIACIIPQECIFFFFFCIICIMSKHHNTAHFGLFLHWFICYVFVVCVDPRKVSCYLSGSYWGSKLRISVRIDSQWINNEITLKKKKKKDLHSRDTFIVFY